MPFEVITVGGDDILLICTAGSALDIACGLGRFFAEGIARELAASSINVAKPLTASVGVVIAHDSMPVLALERAGRELLKSAKAAPTSGAIDFHIVTTPGLDNIHRIRSKEYQGGGPSVLTMRPYALADAERLVHWARALRGEQGSNVGEGMPTSKNSDLYRACRGTRNEATLNVLALHARLAPPQRRMLSDALHDLGSDAYYPFSEPDDQDCVHTALLDLLEASEFVTESWGA